MDKHAISRRMRLVLLFASLTLVHTQSVLEYSVGEEQDPDPSVVIGNLIADSELRDLNQTRLAGALFTIVPLANNNHQYFSVDNEQGAFLLTARIDRDQLCPMLETCSINLDIQVKTDADFYLVKTSIVILDINDEEPQFREESFTFLLSEASAIGMTLNLPTATDLDSPQNGIVGYSVENLNSVFRFDVTENAQEPILILHDSLDREEVEDYTFNLLATDSATMVPHTGSTRVVIQVLDVNDNSPEFAQSSYDVSVDEDMERGYEIIRLTATDIDEGENGRVVYELSARTIETYGDLFEIDGNSGRVTLNGELDYEATQEASLIVIAKNRDASSLFSQTRVHISIQDVNDNAPNIRTIGGAGHQVSMTEYTKENEFVVHVTVSDADTSDGGLFSCSLDSPNFELVKILDTDFKIMTLTTFDRETIASYTLTIVCTDQGRPRRTAQQDVRIIITDENDNTPIFENDIYTLNVTENQATTESLLVVIAIDNDAGANGTVEYRIENATSLVDTYVQIDALTGRIQGKRLLDYEQVTQLHFQVIASDQGNPALSSTCAVTLWILDEDDNPPLFALNSYSIEVRETNDNSSEIGRISASDADSAEFNAITYELAWLDDHTSDFSIDSSTGMIFANISLDREQEGNYTLELYAIGPAPRLHNASVIVYIKVLDINDNEPLFVFPSEDNNTLSLPSYIERHSIIARIFAEDLDDGINARVTYHIVSGDGGAIFQLEETSGYLTMHNDYTVTQTHTAELVILVSDSGVPQQSTTTKLYIEFNETASVISSFSIQSRGKNESIAIVIGVLSGALVVVLLIAIVCLIRRRHSANTKPRRLQSMSESVDGNNSIQFGDGVQGYANPGLDCEEHSPGARRTSSYMGENLSGLTVPVKDSGSEGSNADSGHGSHEETASLHGAGSLQKWDNVFLANDPTRLRELTEHKETSARQNYYTEPRRNSQNVNPPIYEDRHTAHPEDRLSHDGPPPPWLPLQEYHANQPPLGDYHTNNAPIEDYHTNQAPLDDYHTNQAPIEDYHINQVPLEDYHTNQAPIEDYHTNQAHIEDYHTNQVTPYYLEAKTDYVNDSYRESPDTYKDFVDSSSRTRGNVIDLRDYERDQNERFVDEELDTFEERYRHSPGRMPNHIKRRSNSFANDTFPYRDRDVYPDHVAGFCTPQPKNIKYCSQV